MIRRDKNSLLRILGVKKKIEFLIIQTLVDVYGWTLDNDFSFEFGYLINALL
ncbi:DNA-directed RNA polymerase subunit beta'' [Phtheirospermum japonicum]|uniref:DNA-directed RNA polymerase subunit beta n=1 Tax=Phtheirospermum japonicum TaxID=374723 RepID=A0A830BCB7_9LAMI|nr:DNA-directed RNA polymerase subunit beta'' [Phtheirospermum japonicum]